MTRDKQRQPMTQRLPGRGGGPMAMMPGEKAKNFGGTIKNLVRYLGAYKGTIIFVWALAVASSVFAILGPRILGRATDELFTGVLARIAGEGDINFIKIGEIILWLAGLYLLSSVFAYFQGYVMAGVSMKLTYRLRDDINAKIHKLPFQFFDKTTHGEVLSRITNDVDTVSQSLNQSLTQIITSAASILGITVMMFTISWSLTLVTMLILPLSAVLVSIIVKKSHKHFIGQQEYLGHVNGHVEEMFAAHIVVRAFNGEQTSRETFSKYNDKLYQSAWKANFLSGLIMPITGFIGNLAYVAICILGGYFTVNGSMTVGGIQAFIQYVRQFTHPISHLANVSNVLQQTAAAAERVFEFLAEEEETPEVSDALTLTAGDRVEGNVRFEHVSFGYIPEKTLVNDFSSQVKSG
jgi:ATP-binding cassette subfamily B protein